MHLYFTFTFTFTCTQGYMSVVGPEVLETVDADTPPGGLVYEVDSPPNTMYGRLAFADRPQLAVTSFTQQDIDNKRLFFLHDGSKHSYGAIYIKVGRYFHNVTPPPKKKKIYSPPCG